MMNPNNLYFTNEPNCGGTNLFCNKKISQSEDEEGEKVYVGLL